MTDWEAVKARLGEVAAPVSTHAVLVDPSDIHAMLEKLEEVERSLALLDQAATDYRKSRDTAEAKLARCVEAGTRVLDWYPGSDDTTAAADLRAALAAAKGN